jgi:predicted RNA-binding Zn-ribbon protein involved in translation (DUF1610 family)
VFIICRLALFNKKGLDLIEEKFGIEKFLLRLEKECGGQGNGIALTKDNKLIYMHKAVKYSVVTISKQLKKYDWDWCIFHTRVASVGSITDENCHPYKKGNIVLAMNGTESGFSGLAKALDTTDTNAILLSMSKFNLPVFKTLKPLSSNFLGFKNGVAFATSPNSSYKSYDIAKNDEGAIIIASSLPDEFTKFVPTEIPFVWKEEEELKVKEKPKFTVKTYSYRGYDSYDDYYYDTNKKNSKVINSWNEKILDKFNKKNMSDYVCPDCREIIRGSELIEDMGVKYCPLCGEEVKEKDRITDKLGFLVD